MKASTFHSPWLDWKKSRTPNRQSAKSDRRAFDTFGTSLSRDFSPTRRSDDPVEHWDVRRIEIPSQTKLGYVDVWMVAERTYGTQQIRFWFGGTEPIQNHGEEMSENG